MSSEKIPVALSTDSSCSSLSVPPLSGSSLSGLPFSGPSLSGPSFRQDSLSFEYELHQATAERNRSATAFSYERCLHHLVEEQARRTPDATALVFRSVGAAESMDAGSEQRLTYRELDQRANRLAHLLAARGIGPESLVGLHLGKGIDAIVGILGIFKAGAAYVPLDPVLPPERLEWMLRDTQASFVLTHSTLSPPLTGETARLLYLDQECSEPPSLNGTDPLATNPPDSGVGPGNLAYVIYTSGSTGRPKGVLIEHRSVCNNVQGWMGVIRLGREHRVLQLASLSFDVSVLEIFSTLGSGAELHLAPPEQLHPGPDLVRVLRERHINVLDTTPSVLSALLPDELPELKTITVGAEECPAQLVARWAPGRRMRNGYGPTETAIGASWAECRPQDGKPSIGRAMPNYQIHVLGEDLQPVCAGAEGEIYIGGVGVARGYLNQPELTAQKFIPDPFSVEPGARLYKTGDLGRFLPDGNLEFLGRTDQQVKLRGLRIELGEIESVLSSHPDVLRCAVLLREDAPGDKRLVAYIVLRDGGTLDPKALRAHLARKLPDYMLPAAFVPLHSLPLTSSGKLDRKALPAPSPERGALAFVPPQSPAEQLLADLFASVLRLDRVGRNDDFFALGGHSLVAIQLLSRIRTAFSIELTLRSLFSHSSVQALAAYLGSLSSSSSGPDLPLVPIPRDGILQLSFAQQRLWFLDQLEPGLAFYNIPLALHLRGPLDTEALGSAFVELVRRHESLRTSFPCVQGQPRQLISDPPSDVLSRRSLPEDGNDSIDSRINRLAAQEAASPFSLSQGPLFRASLVQVAPEHHVLLVTLHHTISDGWSLSVLLRDLQAFYSAALSGSPSALPPLPVQVADVAHWERQRLAADSGQSHLTYWQQQLAGLSPLELPTDHPRPPVFSYRGRTHSISIPAALGRALKELSLQNGCTLFMTLLAGLQTLLARHTGQTDLSIGTPIAHRSRCETEELIGFFVNTLVLRGQVDPEAPFATLLQHAKEICLQAYAQKDVPFERLVEILSPQRDLSRTPLFQVMLVLQNTPKEDLQLPGVCSESIEADNGTAKFDLTISLQEEPDGSLRGTLEYASDLWEPQTMHRLWGHLLVLLQAAAQAPSTRLCDLPLLTAPERSQLLIEWNDTAAPSPDELCIHQLFESQAACSPGSLAVVFSDQQLTYAQLNQRANQLAHTLRELGVGPEVLVGICIPRSLEMVVAALAILKAGGAYVPIDPNYPAERIHCLLEDARPRVLLTLASLLDRLPPHEAQTLCLDDPARFAQAPADNPVPSASGHHLAYVIYTSGSTGRPKGVAIEHRAALNTLLDINQRFSVGPADRVLGISSLSFDLSVWDLFGVLGAGGTLVLPEPEAQREPSRWAAWLSVQRISIWNSVPALMSMLLDGGFGLPPSLRLCLLSGDWIPVSLPAKLKEQAPQCRLFSLGGATEASIWSIFFPVDQVDPEWLSIPYGRPLLNQSFYVLDPWLRPCPIGVVGELFIGGLGVARGYLNRPELSAQRFLPDPFSARPGARMYRTGDLGRFFPDGNIEFLGRMDQQVKLRGFRIELGEIETVLSSHPDVLHCVLLLRQDSPGDKRLVAYVVLRDACTLDAQALRAHLARKLPDYMLPAAFVSLSALPLTPNGKLDRKALPAPSTDRDAQEFVAPQSPSEQLLADLFASVLRLARVGRFDDFFSLGGHSLLAIQLLARIRSSFSVDLPLRSLFAHSSVQALAAHLDSLSLSSDPGLPLVPVPRDQPLPLSFAQLRLWLLDQLEPGLPLYNIPMALSLRGPLDVAALESAFVDLVRRHESLRTSFACVEGQPRQLISDPPSHVLQRHSLPEGPDPIDSRILRLAVKEASTPFILSKGPLFRASLVQVAPEHHVLLITLHHIISDGWSVSVLLRELQAFYSASVADLPAGLPALPVQVADVAHWERLRLAQDSGQLSYWQQQLAGASPLELPTDRPRPLVFSYRGRTHSISIPAPLGRALKQLSLQQGCTLFMTLLAGLQTLLARYTGQTDLSIGSPIAHRSRAETESLIGFFVNTLVLRGQLDLAAPFASALQQAKEVCLQAYAQKDVPFERLVEALSPQRDLSRTPLFQVMLALQSTPLEAVKLPGVRSEWIDADNGTAKFDLTILLQEESDGSLCGFLEYASDLWEPQSMHRLWGHLLVLLQAAVERPQTCLCDLPLMTEPERTQLLVHWNDTAASRAPQRCIHDLFEAQAALSPDSIAVVFGEQHLTYAQLNQRANQLAHLLRARGVGPEARVGLSVPRSLEMVVGALGIVKAGAAYVPIDPDYPEDRIRFLLEDAAPRVLLTLRSLGSALSALAVPTLCLDDPALFAHAPTDNPTPLADGHNLAYVIYTSGSTGRPKGVCIEHQAALNTLVDINERFSVGPADRVLGISSLSFDLSVWDLFGMLGAGGRLVLPEPDSQREPARWARWLSDQGITIWNSVPALMGMLLDGEYGLPPCLRLTMLSGDWIPVSLPAKLQEQAPQSRLISLGGATEASIWSITYPVDRVEPHWVSIPYGRPMRNQQFHVLDRWMRPCPIGVVGELFIGGAGVARGYLNRPELTAEKFLSNPFRKGAGEKLYRTGDLGRYLPDGNIEFLGRMDHQVKLRGFRIELGEIESVLATHPDVQSCVVVLREDTPGDKRLVAYVILREGAAFDPQALRSHLGQKLPDYMLPAAFVSLHAIPLTPNGKLDRKALPAPSLERGSPSFVAPQSRTEQILADLFASVLRLERVGRFDDFFSLGGHSLLAVQLLSRIRSAFSLELPLRSLFSHSTVHALACHLDSVAGTGCAALPPLVPVPRDLPLALSFAQQRLWFLDQMEPGLAFYNIPLALHLRGALDVRALDSALVELVRRHEPLRTRFASQDGAPLQLIAEPPQHVLSRRSLPEGDESADAKILRAAAQEAVAPFSLSLGPLFRAHLLSAAPEHHALLLTLHHIIADGWSVSVLLRELTALYAAALAGRPSPLAPLPVQAADVAQWERTVLQGEAGQTHLSYWHQQLQGLTPLELPADRPRPPVFSYRGRTLPVAIPAQLGRSLKALSLAKGTTLFMTLLTGLQCLLARYTGQTDIAIGSPIAHRSLPETESLIGFFVNTLVLRSQLDLESSFDSALHQAKEVCLQAYAHQDVPFERLVEVLSPQRDLSRTPLFQVMLALQNTPEEQLQLPGVQTEWIETDSGTSKFDLTISLQEGPDGSLCGSLEYASDLWEPESMHRLWGHLLVLLQAAVERPQTHLCDLPLLTEPERSQLLDAWNDTRTEVDLNRPFHEIFAEHAAGTPDAAAVVEPHGRTLSYAELDRSANQLARSLQALGVAPERRVAMCLPRSPEAMIAILAILKAGGAYVPLDPAYPRERLAFMLQDAAPVALLTSTQLRALLPPSDLPCVYLDADQEKIRQNSDRPIEPATQPHHLAYVIYTSGSTGRPKGVLVEHRSLSNLCAAQRLTYGLVRSGRVLQFSSLSFDSSIAELAQAWAVGATLVLSPPGTPLLGAELGALLQEQRIRMVTLPPSALPDLPLELCADLEILLVAGEACSAANVDRWAPGRKLFNAYGPTEATVCSTTFRCQPHRGAPPIGRPIPNVRTYILDQNQNPVPIGVPAEVYVGGAGVARGYLNQPELTVQKFIPDPFSPEPGARLYRTGDLGRFLPDGEIEFLGRIDHQVKLRGLRIELGEIESVLSSHPEVLCCTVVLREYTPGDKRLVAYVVLREGTALDRDALRSHLSQKLPEYMLPSAFVSLSALPLTPNGKVDRKALPAPSQAQCPAALVAPQSPTEQRVAELFASVLGLARVGRSDDFFSLGGHSLLAVQLLSRIRSSFSLELPLRALFSHPSVAALSAHLDSLAGSRSGSALPLVPVPRDRPLALSFAQQRLWFLDQLEPGLPFYNIPLALHLRGPLQVPSLDSALVLLVQRHEALRTTFPSQLGSPVQLIAAPPEQVLSLLALPEGSESVDAKILRLASQQAAEPFSLSQGPLFRARLIAVAQEHHVLLLTLHHIIADGWSVSVLLRELSSLYSASLTGRPSPLAPLPVQVADVAHWERSLLQGDAGLSLLSYWQQQLLGITPLELPTDRPRPPVFSYRGSTLQVAIPSHLGLALKQLALANGATLFMALLTGLQVLLARYSGQSDLCIGSPIAHRTRTETESLIGFFVNTLVLRGLLDLQAPFELALQHAREVCLQAYAHQDIPFERLVEVLSPQRDLSRTPLFQVMLALQNTPTEELHLPGVQTQWIETDSGTAKFDLTISLQEEPDGSLRGSLEYATDLWDAETMQRLWGHLLVLLQAAVERPQTRLCDLPLLTESEREQLLVHWNDTASPPPPQRCIHDLFEAQAGRSPDSVAVVFGRYHLTYGQLDQRANQLAHVLRARGVGAEDRVGLCVPRSLEMVIGALGILKSGAAYVPIDPDYPEDRIRFVLEDAAPRVLLTLRSLQSALSVNPVPALCLDDPSLLASGSADPLPPLAEGHNLAYVIYTSGSTGRPKGVCIEHRAALNTLVDINDRFSVGPADCVLGISSLSFDLSVWDLFGVLGAGGRLVLPEPDAQRDPARWARWLAEQGITIWNSVPALMGMLLEGGYGLPPTLRLTMLSGDWIPVNLPARLQEQAPQCRLISLGGATEASIWSITYPVERVDPQWVSIPYGKPMRNQQFHVLDRWLHPCPIGVVGELFIGGRGVARGYLNRPELNAQKFLPNPFQNGEGETLYRTGDLGKYLPDGNIEFLGRMDQQVKLRGFRIELGEIETVLATHPDVTSSVVMLREDTPGDKRLVAYVIVREGSNLDPQALRVHLGQKLPDYMLPASFVQLSALPLSPNGKLDRKALPAPSYRAEEDAYAAPRNQLELQLARIWESTLGVYPVGIRDNFFALGGHSLLAVRLLSVVQEQLGHRLSLSTLFQEPTVAQLALRLSAQGAATPQSELVAIQPRGVLPPLFCVHSGTGDVTYFASLARHLGTDRPFYAFQARGFEEGQLPRESVEEMAAAYCEQLRRIQPEGPYHLAGHCLGGQIVFEMAHQLTRAGHEVALLALIGSFADPPPCLPDESGWLLSLAQDLALIEPTEMLAELSHEARLQHVLALAQQTDHLPSWYGTAELARWVQIHRALVHASQRYVRRPLATQLTLFRTQTPAFRADLSEDGKRAYGWDTLTDRPVQICELPGTQETLFKEPYVGTLAERIKEVLRSR